MDPKYKLFAANGEHIDTFDCIADAVLAAAGHDGWGATYARLGFGGTEDPAAPMALYSSRRHIGNNSYYPVPADSFGFISKRGEDSEARHEVAMEVWAHGVLHSRYDLGIEEVAE